ncbi:hypothetical protein N481_00290 [Pseudoalteromonas luteoviolacea S4047-1]|uniref:Uncharacterized protein n=1 Tax=Pseudoalteromonas luteoviolacea S4054 TaxID=1129367 RepID=A0A0F6A8U7_9GAMM|nr:hypothetical protein N479_18660 [Pseudoalteromonas luteoviolacea S4054]KZN78913.1 hypothetical protein N481_00290 [Pseudoalteromonas luteoviolacea S4047-1]
MKKAKIKGDEEKVLKLKTTYEKWLSYIKLS